MGGAGCVGEAAITPAWGRKTGRVGHRGPVSYSKKSAFPLPRVLWKDFA